MARLEDTSNEAAYRYYVTDSIYHYTHNQALNLRFVEMMDKEKMAQRNKSGDEIVADMVKNAGITLR